MFVVIWKLIKGTTTVRTSLSYVPCIIAYSAIKDHFEKLLDGHHSQSCKSNFHRRPVLLVQLLTMSVFVACGLAEYSSVTMLTLI